MSTIYANLKGASVISRGVGGPDSGVVAVTFTVPAYVASSDNVQLGGGGYAEGEAMTATLAAYLAAQNRQGRTYTFQNATNGLGMTAEPGAQGSTEFWAGSFATSAGNVTLNLTNVSGTEIDAAAGVVDRPITVHLAFRAAS